MLGTMMGSDRQRWVVGCGVVLRDVAVARAPDR